MINPKAKRYVASGVNGSTGETVVVVPDSANLFRITVGTGALSGDTADIYVFDTNNATLADTSGSGNVVAHIDGHCTGTYEFDVALNTGLTYRVSGDYAAGDAPTFTIVFE